MLMMRPHRRARIPGSTACVTRKHDFRLTVEQFVPILLGDLFDALHPGDPGVVHQDVDVAQFRADGIHQAIDPAGKRDVGLDRGASAPQTADLSFRRPSHRRRESCN